VVAAALVVAVLLSGCSTTAKISDWIRGGNQAAVKTPDLETYLAELSELSSGDAGRQANIYDDARAAAELAPDPGSTLRLALVLATPGHAQSDPGRAVTLLREVLQQEASLTTEQRSLASVYLANAERLVAVTGEVARLRDSSAQANRAEQQSSARRIAAVEAENERLRKELEEAEQKLEAITSIERSIREQQ
jgi:outer membrane murein-binding lipoprotein Lpp